MVKQGTFSWGWPYVCMQYWVHLRVIDDFETVVDAVHVRCAPDVCAVQFLVYLGARRAAQYPLGRRQPRVAVPMLFTYAM